MTVNFDMAMIVRGKRAILSIEAEVKKTNVFGERISSLTIWNDKMATYIRIDNLSLHEQEIIETAVWAEAARLESIEEARRERNNPEEYFGMANDRAADIREMNERNGWGKK